MQLVDEASSQEVVPERAAAEPQDVLSLTALELGDMRACVATFDDAREVAPGLRLLSGRGPDTTTFSIALLILEISRCVGVQRASESSATDGQKSP